MSEVAATKLGQIYVDAVRQLYSAAVLAETWQADNQVTLTVDLNSLPDIVETLYYRHDGWLSTIAANDERQLNGNYALYYILSMEGPVDACRHSAVDPELGVANQECREAGPADRPRLQSRRARRPRQRLRA